MNFLNKKISLGVGLAVLFVTSSVIYSVGYKFAMDKFNSLVSINQEKQKVYGNLSEIDYNIKNEYIGKIDENKVFEGICRGYVSSVDDCRLLTQDEYSQELENKKSFKPEVSWDEIDETFGYLRCKTLGSGSADMLIERVEYFNSKGINKIILDLRFSEKGNMEEGFKILQYLLPEGDAVYLSYKDGKRETVCKSTGKGYDSQIIILVNENSMGTAEVIASALKDSLNAKIIGEKTPGNFFKEKATKISEDIVVVFPDAKYFTAKEEDLYKKGLLPDETVILSDEDLKLLKEENLEYVDDAQLQVAIKSFSE